MKPNALSGTNTGVYTASCISDNEGIGCDEKLTLPFWLVAHARSLLANRVSNILNLQGPSYSIDSTWIGGIEALKQAVDDIAKGRIDTALVGVSNIILQPETSKQWTELGKLSIDGMCRSFDENGKKSWSMILVTYNERFDV